MNRKQGKALLALILSEIRSNAYLLEPILQENMSSSIKGSPILEYELLLTRINDGMELCQDSSKEDFTLREVDFGQIADDFAQAYSRRFGSKLASTVSILIDPSLTKVKTHPGKIMRIIDCMVRAIHKSGVGRPAELIIRASKKRSASENFVEVVFVCKNVPFAGDEKGLEALFQLFESEDYSKFIHNAGLELCTALHAANSLGAKIFLEKESHDSILVEFRFNLERQHGVKTDAEKLPEMLYLQTSSDFLKKTMEKFAHIYCSKLKIIDDPSQVPSGQFLIYDARDLDVESIAKIKKLPEPEKTVLLFPVVDLLRWREFAAVGFRSFLTLPFVSSKLYECLRGAKAYEMPKSEVEAASNQKLRVLIVDDAATARIVLRDYFESEGHGVTEAADGSEFVTIIKSGERFDVIFCDLTMCHMDGVTAVEMVRKIEAKAGRRTPVVLMTAYAATDAETRLQEAQFDRVLYKPVLMNQVKKILKDLALTRTAVQSRPIETVLIDIEDLRSRCSGKEKLMIRILESFIDASQSHLPRLVMPKTHADRIVINRVIHTLKGLFRDVGAQKAAKTVEELEQKMRDANSNIEPDLKQLSRLVLINCESAQSLKKSLQSKSI